MAAERGRSGGLRLLIAWLLTALIISVYFSLPDGEDAPGLDSEGATQEPAPARIEVVAVTPEGATPGSAITVQFAGAARADQVSASVGKTELEVLSRLDDGRFLGSSGAPSNVAALPAGTCHRARGVAGSTLQASATPMSSGHENAAISTSTGWGR